MTATVTPTIQVTPVRKARRRAPWAVWRDPSGRLSWLRFVSLLFLFLPLFIACIILVDWQWALAVFAPRFILQGIFWKIAMSRLDEADLWPWYPLLDAWMFLYYLTFAPALWKRPKASWK